MAGDGAYKRKILTVKLWKSGTDAAISVSDTGRGMDTQELERAFDPFFTTKKSAKAPDSAYL